ncbi:MAG: V-type H+-transporting ATPase subunit F [archaeon GW2011_AR3]|nr:MAG: V-type H+-transporting ATPase subunit F [archaeon GW2011_AR3]MBS3109377.1 V-type ATP synthase subunit F [Candidatus Woesearchaeota archaeon]
MAPDNTEKMLEIAVAGTSRFILGFQLAGIRHTHEIESDHYNRLKQLMSDPAVGIIITEEKIMEKLDEHDKNEIESSVRPVVIMLSDQASSESLRKMIGKSVGIDLWG